MATKPSQLPEWASGAADITDPTLLKKQTGWIAGGEKPPHDYFNWWMKLVWTWCVYLDAFLTDAHTWVGTQTFAVLNAASAAITGTITAANATISSTVTANTVTASVMHGGYLDLTTNPSVGTGQTNTLTAKNIRKAWGAFNAGAGSLTEGFNAAISYVATASSGNTSNPSSKVVRVTFGTAMASADYYVNAAFCDTVGNNLYTCHVTYKTASLFEFCIRRTDGVFIDPSTAVANFKISFGVDGRQ